MEPIVTEICLVYIILFGGIITAFALPVYVPDILKKTK